MESLGLTGLQPAFWSGKRVLLTGHTGFKGGWLSLWLQSLGAEVHGLALPPPTSPNLFEAARVRAGMASAVDGDIRDLSVVRAAMAKSRPEIVLHLAAQPLVRLSYREPVATYATNVMGTIHVLEAARELASVRAIVNVTTDKCYENREWVWGYREDEPMGGHDPYSNSKGCSELVTAAYRRSFFSASGVAVATARAGNVIGGGDWAEDRLVPDVLRAFERSEVAVLRHPDAVRPWQHVLEPLSGYLVLAQRLCEAGQPFAEGWNFGPQDGDARPVRWIVDKLAEQWGEGAGWRLAEGGDFLHEALSLKLDISKAFQRLRWAPRWPLADALRATTRWHRAWLAGADMHAACLEQIQQYTDTVDEHHERTTHP